jgi:uncharacterized protein (TIGR02271 family)
MLSILGQPNHNEALTELHFSDGRIVRLPTAMLEAEQAVEPAGDTSREEGTTLMPLIEEQLEITKRTVVTGKVLLEKTVEAYDVTLDEPLAVSSWKVERVVLGHVVQTAPPVREEDLTTIYPVLKERMVLTKELLLVEEIRVTREFSERRDPQTFTLRREHLDIQRKDLVGN